MPNIPDVTGVSSFINFVVSDYFLWFWILLVTTIIFLPFGIYGMVYFFKWVDRTFVKPKKGYIIVRQFLPNEREEESYRLPTGKFIDLPDVEGNMRKVPIKLEKGMVKYVGNTPVVEFDENGIQRPLGKGATTTISQEETTKGWKSAYETGKLIGSLEILADWKRLLIIGIVAMCVVSGIGAYLSYNTNEAVSKLGKSPAQYVNQSYQPPATGGNNQAPTVS